MHDTLRLHCRAADASPSIDAVVAAISGRPDPVVLGAGGPLPDDLGRSRWTLFACEPVRVCAWQDGVSDPFDGMRHQLIRQTLTIDPACEISGLPAFLGGWIGFFAYEAGRYIEPSGRAVTSPARDVGLPIARFALYDTLAACDALTGRWVLLAADLPPTALAGARRPSAADRLDGWEASLREAESVDFSAAWNATPAGDPAENMSRDAYLRMVARAKEYIAAGDIYQVNLARRLSVPQREPVWRTWLRMRRTNPGAYSAFLSWADPGDAAILCGSPELFLDLRGRDVITCPIKGTRERSSDPIVDAARCAELAASEKDRAELAMIVDLERNDLGRVCEYGSVRVAGAHRSPADPYDLQSFRTVHHLVATVTGRLAASCDAIDLLRASFPGGSITGAPKVRSMQIIDELEPTERSVYTGSIGWFGLDGSMSFNIAIRTMIAAGRHLHVYAGGGIVADSVPELEFEETQAKARGLLAALGLAEEISVRDRHLAGQMKPQR